LLLFCNRTHIWGRAHKNRLQNTAQLDVVRELAQFGFIANTAQISGGFADSF
jgi:hypothetical protein